MINQKTDAIGVIDSGIGGFSVARRVQELLPQENILYLGDGANTPYGNHTAEEILEMTRYMLRFMDSHNVKALLVACNTISCLIDQYRDEMRCPVLSVVQAGADAVAATPYQRVGVISTCFTAQSGCYPNLIHKQAPERQVFSHGCPDLANLVEQNVGDPAAQPAIDAEIRAGLDGLVNVDHIQCCVLGCTHYPLVSDTIEKLYPGLPLIDPAQQMAQELKAYLTRTNLLRDENLPGRLDVFTTGDVDEYALRARQVGLDPVSSVSYHPPMALD